MIEDARALADGSRIECEVCIVGAGPAGITVALELEKSGARICLLESGGLRYQTRSQALLEGTAPGTSYSLRETRFAGLGGSSAVWAGWCRPLDPIDFAARPWVPNSGWPFGLEALDSAYRRAQELCGLGPPDYDPVAWARRTGIGALPLAGDDIQTAIFHVSPVHFGRTYRRRLERSALIRVLLHATVLRCHAAAGSDRIERVTVGTPSGGGFEVDARLFVLAAGGVENPRLLLLSGDSPETAIGNDYGLVGRYFTEHAFIEPGTFLPRDPMTSLNFFFPMHAPSVPRGAAVRGVLSLQPDTLTRERLLNAAVFFLPAYESRPIFADPAVKAMLNLWDQARGRGVPGQIGIHLIHAARSPHRVIRAAWSRLAVRPGRVPRWRLRAFAECESLAENRVSLGHRRDPFDRPLPELHWSIGERDLASFRRALALVDRALTGSGQGRLELAWPDEPDRWRAAAHGGKHHMGTTRMHASPSCGVVHADARVHGTANLFVAGSSVFPTGGYANPTLTIIALAIRLAMRLRLLL